MQKNNPLNGIFKVIYYKFFLNVNWEPSYNPITDIYGVKIQGIKMFFKNECPFYDIENDLQDYINNLSPENSRCFVDAGSFIGTEAIYFAKLSPYNFVVALEPDLDNYQKLLKNISLNHIKNIFPINSGLWKSPGYINFSSNGNEMSGVTFENDQKSIRIKTTTLDDIYLKFNRNIDYVKMDIEGAEIEALQGGIKCIKKCYPKFIIATYHIRDGYQTKGRVEEFLNKYYTNIKSIHSKQLLTTASHIT